MNKPWIALSLDELLHGATERVSVRSSDARSGAFFEKLIIDGRPCFLKVVSAEDDWIMRVTGNKLWEFQVWRAGLYQRAPAIIDHAMIGMALDDSAGQPRMAMLMHDRSRDLVPPGDDPISASQHAVFIRHLALMHAANLGWEDDLGLYPLARRPLFFAPAAIAPELARDQVPVTLQVAKRGWALLPERDAGLFELVTAVHRDPATLAGLLAETPQTFIAGDWKLGNLGTRPTGETVLLDWAYPGEAPPAWGACLVLSSQSSTDTREQVRHHRALSAGTGKRRCCDQRVVGTTGWVVPAGHGSHDGLGEGSRGRRGARLVVRAGPRGRRSLALGP
jgi:hypothetical protein